MLYWNANFQIPDSGVQAADVYVVATKEDNSVLASFYADPFLLNTLFSKAYEAPEGTEDLYSYLLTLDEFANYTRAE